MIHFIYTSIVICARIDQVNTDHDLVTVEFRGLSPFTCQLDYRYPKPCTSPVTYTGLSAGRHRVHITGNSRTCEANTTFIIPGKLSYLSYKAYVKIVHNYSNECIVYITYIYIYFSL